MRIIIIRNNYKLCSFYFATPAGKLQLARQPSSAWSATNYDFFSGDVLIFLPKQKWLNSLSDPKLGEKAFAAYITQLYRECVINSKSVCVAPVEQVDTLFGKSSHVQLISKKPKIQSDVQLTRQTSL